MRNPNTKEATMLPVDFIMLEYLHKNVENTKKLKKCSCVTEAPEHREPPLRPGVRGFFLRLCYHCRIFYIIFSVDCRMFLH